MNKTEKPNRTVCSLSEPDNDRLCVLAADLQVRINCCNVEGHTPLILLCKFNNFGNGFLGCFEALNLRTDLDVTIQDNLGKTALNFLCYWNLMNAFVNIVNRLLQLGIGVNVPVSTSYLRDIYYQSR